MSIFYCQHHHKMEDSDFVGYVLLADDEYCDEGAAELLADLDEHEELFNDEDDTKDE